MHVHVYGKSGLASDIKEHHILQLSWRACLWRCSIARLPVAAAAPTVTALAWEARASSTA